ncbi:MAG TPA: peptidylprolyl isomerase [Acidimicrobiia bacterium]|jgi:cyclophilin family peptidyl-prolyl cis-trans isomerase|nr:peptidylprolyl isomerase [Acidimicrobiia bacterium]
MPDPKRERQRQNREAARAAQLEAAKQQRKKQSTIRFAVLIGLAVVLAILSAALFGGKKDKKVSAADQSTTTTAAGETSTTAVNPALAAIQCTDTKPAEVPNRPTFTTAPPMTVDQAKKYTAVIDTSCGKITLDLDAKGAPKTVNNFVFLAQKHFYDGLTWHRVVKDFVIQGGDPEGTGGGGPGYSFEDELPTDGYKLGSLAMANSGANTNGSQFFIVTGQNGTTLENKYSRFGMVTGGLDVAQKLESFADPAQKPTRPLYIMSISISVS